MAEALMRRLGQHYILAMMALTRVFGSTGGLMVVYYVEFILDLSEPLHTRFRVMCFVVVVVAVALTLMLAMWETRTLRRVIAKLNRGESVDPDEGERAGYEAVYFAARHHRHESWLVPCSTFVPVILMMAFIERAPVSMLINITLTVFMATGMALMAHYFAVDYGMRPVIGMLLRHKVPINYNAIPHNRLMQRMRVCFTLIIIASALMTGTMARQRALDIIQAPSREEAVRAVVDLRNQSIYIMIAAAVSGIVLSSVLAHSVVDRLAALVRAMESVGEGDLSVRARPVGNDELDRLARQFNTMVQQLARNNQTIHDLNLNLEQKVKDRTLALENALTELRETQSQLTDLARSAGMAEVATGVLHNVGNVLNSVNISTELVADRVESSRVADLERVVSRLAEHRDRLGEFLTAGDRAVKLLEYLETLTGKLHDEHREVKQEIYSLVENVGHIKGIIAAQQNYARRVVFREEIQVQKLVCEALEMHTRALMHAQVRVVRQIEELPSAMLEKAKLFQITDNLIRNAIESMRERGGTGHTLTVRLIGVPDERARLTITDTGVGIRDEHKNTMFTFGFTTKPGGNGFGLHSSALAIADLGGIIRAQSEGPGRGATFMIEFPLRTEERAVPSGSQTAERGVGEEPEVIVEPPGLRAVPE